jgi:exopolysaccharide biosynthesis WecB/TagA/CpsF family protein
VKLLGWLESVELARGYLVTVNLQHLYECRRNPPLRHAVFDDKNCRMCLDGRGAHLLFERFLRTELPLTVGNEVLFRRLSLSAGSRVLVVGSSAETIDATRRIFRAVDFMHDDSVFPQLDADTARGAAERITGRFGTAFGMVAIALGVPKQELLAQAMSERIPDIPIYCIGGSFEIITGRLRRAPRLMQLLGLEGAWRMLVEPNRARFERLVLSYWNFAMFYIFRDRLPRLVNGPASDT